MVTSCETCTVAERSVEWGWLDGEMGRGGREGEGDPRVDVPLRFCQAESMSPNAAWQHAEE